MKMVVDARQQYFPELASLLARLDHDVRSPLTAICGYAECLGWLSAPDADSRERYAGAIVGQARRLGRLIANAATLTTPQQDAPLVELNFTAAVEDALRELAGTTALQEMTVAVRAPVEAISVFWSRAVLSQLLLAALESVLDAAGERAVVEIDIRSEAREVALAISAQSDWPVPFNADSLAFRAAARLVGTRGGSLLWRDGAHPHLQLQLPFSGRLVARLAEGLEATA